MKLTFRWYGEADTIPLSYIKQIPTMYSVVTAVYNTPVGEVWKREDLKRLKTLCDSEGLAMEVIESVPVHENIKLGEGKRDQYIENYCENIRRLSEVGVKCICYNFMPVFDWLRSNLAEKNNDGSTSLSYIHDELIKKDCRNLSLPGWDESYTREELIGLLDKYKGISHQMLFNNLVYFLEKIIPVCERCGVNMAIHPDDPPWDIYGLPRIICCESDYKKLFDAVPSKYNGITFCTGSLGANGANDLVALAEKYAKEERIHFVHLRNVKRSGEFNFAETAHPTECGSLDMYGIVQALVRGGFKGYVRPDHGRNIWGEVGKPGYGLFDRALGACYLAGLFEAIEKTEGIQ